MDTLCTYNQVTVGSLDNFGFFKYYIDKLNQQYTLTEYGNDDFNIREMDGMSLFMGQFVYLCDKNIKNIVDKFNQSVDDRQNLFDKADLKLQISKADSLLNLMDAVKYTLVTYKSFLSAATFFENSQCEDQKMYLSAPDDPVSYGKKVYMQLTMEFQGVAAD